MTSTLLISPTATAQSSTSTWCASQDRIAVLGASSETGYGTTGYDPTVADEYDATRYGWVARVARNASAEWDTATDVYAHNGATIADFLPDEPNPGGRHWPTTHNAIDNVEATQPDLILIGGAGANEYVSNVAPATYEAHLRDLVQQLRDARSGVDIILITHPDIQWPDAERPWQDYAAITDQVARDTGSGLVDMRQYIDSPSTTGAAGVWYSDDAHLADAGQASQSSTMWTLLWSAVGGCGTT